MRNLLILAALFLVANANAQTDSFDEAAQVALNHYNEMLVDWKAYESEVTKLNTIKTEYNNASSKIYNDNALKARFKREVESNLSSFYRNKLDEAKRAQDTIDRAKRANKNITDQVKSWQRKQEKLKQEKKDKIRQYKKDADRYHNSHVANVRQADMARTTARLAQNNYNLCMNNCRNGGYTCYCNSYLQSKRNAINNAGRYSRQADTDYSNHKRAIDNHNIAVRDYNDFLDWFKREDKKIVAEGNSKLRNNNDIISRNVTRRNDAERIVASYVNPKIAEKQRVAITELKEKISKQYDTQYAYLKNNYGGTDLIKILGKVSQYIINKHFKTKTPDNSTILVDYTMQICDIANGGYSKVQNMCGDMDFMIRALALRAGNLEDRLEASPFFNTCWYEKNENGEFSTIVELAGKLQLKTCESILLAIKDSTHLKLGSTKLKTLAPYGEFTHLTMLEAQYNELTSLKGIEKFQNLTTLYINNNKLLGFDELKDLPNLNTVSLYGNGFNKGWLKKNVCKPLGIEKKNCLIKE